MKNILKNRTIVATLLLVASIAVLLGLITYGNIAAIGLLEAKVAKTKETKDSASQSSADLQSAQKLEQYLESRQSDIKRAAEIVADTKSYQYQNQIVTDINRYATEAGVTILGYDFPVAIAGQKSTTTSLKTMNASVTLQNPVPYNNYLKLLKLIEQNLTKMQVTEISVTPDDKLPGYINNPKIGIQVYVR